MRPVGLAAIALTGGLLAGCATDEAALSPDPAAEASGGQTPDGHGGAVFNPCDDLTAAFVGRQLGGPVTRDVGTEADPRCAFVPTRTGAPALEVNYLVYTGPLDEIFATMGPVAGSSRVLDVPTARDARLVVNATAEGLALTGFVQTGAVVEVVNTVALAPYDRKTVVAGTRAVLDRLSRRAARRSADD